MEIDPDLRRRAEQAPDSIVEALVVCSAVSEQTLDGLRAAGFEIGGMLDPEFGTLVARVRAGLLLELPAIEGVDSIADAPEQRAL